MTLCQNGHDIDMVGPGNTYKCRQCQRDSHKRWRDRNLDRIKIYTARTRYRIELGDLPTSCAVCGTDQNLVIDHSHTTKAYRGRLCQACNKGIGFLQDSPDLCRKAATYLGG